MTGLAETASGSTRQPANRRTSLPRAPNSLARLLAHPWHSFRRHELAKSLGGAAGRLSRAASASPFTSLLLGQLTSATIVAADNLAPRLKPQASDGQHQIEAEQQASDLTGRHSLASTMIVEQPEERLMLMASSSRTNDPLANETIGLSSQQSVDVNVLLTVVYLAIFVIGIVGNVCNCLVIADSRNKYMKTATNYYLFSLSISDLLLLIFGLPHDLVNLWHPSPYMFSEFVCISRGWISEASTYASVLVIVAFTVERYLAICHPLKAHTLSRLSRSIKIIISIWLLASSCALVVVLQYGVIQVTEHEPSGSGRSYVTTQCTTTSKNETIFELSSILFFIIPMIILTVLYVKLGYHLKQKTRLLKKSRNLHQRQLASTGSSCHQSPSHQQQQQASECLISMADQQQQKQPLTSDRHHRLAQRCSEASSLRANDSPSSWPLANHQPPASTPGTPQLQQPLPARQATSVIRANGHSVGKQPHGQTTVALQSTVSTANVPSVIKMLVSVVVMFFICWAPFHAQRLMAIYVTEPTKEQEIIYTVLDHISGISYYISAVVNPILYSLFSIKFRQAFRDTFGSIRLCGLLVGGATNVSPPTITEPTLKSNRRTSSSR